MSRYFFHLRNDIRCNDEEGTDLADDAAARAFAVANVRAVACASVAEGHLDLDHFIAVTDSDGHAKFNVTFGDAIAVVGRERELEVVL